MRNTDIRTIYKIIDKKTNEFFYLFKKTEYDKENLIFYKQYDKIEKLYCKRVFTSVVFNQCYWYIPHDNYIVMEGTKDIKQGYTTMSIDETINYVIDLKNIIHTGKRRYNNFIKLLKEFKKLELITG